MEELPTAQETILSEASSSTETETKPQIVESDDIFSVLGNKANDRDPDANSGAVKLPPAPQSISDLGLSSSFLMELAMKIVRFMDGPTSDQVARGMGLTTALTQEIIEQLKADRLCEVIGGGSYDLPGRYKLRLTDKGEERAEQALERCRYAGAAPVPIEQYERTLAPVLSERLRPSRDAVRHALENLVLNPETSDLLERALCSGRTSMVYGPSGNGKTHLLTEFVRTLEGEILCPRAIYAYGQIVRIYDKLVHDVVDDRSDETNGDVGRKSEEIDDHRWVKIRRPGLIMGGEVTAESLELGYDPIARFYQAPKHLKAQGGVLVIDDFGRQKVAPEVLLDRWIMALERGRDNLMLRTGENIDVPFSMTILLSTNIDPTELADAAHLRRIFYKAYVPPVAPDQFKEIVRGMLVEAGIDSPEEHLDQAIAYLSETTSGNLSGSLPRDLVSIVVDNAEHDGKTPDFDIVSVKLAYKQFTGTAGRDVV